MFDLGKFRFEGFHLRIGFFRLDPTTGGLFAERVHISLIERDSLALVLAFVVVVHLGLPVTGVVIAFGTVKRLGDEFFQQCRILLRLHHVPPG